MKKKENNKVNKKIIIIVIVILLLIIFCIWFFWLRDKDKEYISGNNKQENTNSQNEYDKRDGVLISVLDKEEKMIQNDFIIDGIILIGNRHSYFDTKDTDTIIDNFVKKGYQKDGINSSFYLNERIEFYIDTKYQGSNDNIKIFIIPHKKMEEVEKMTFNELSDLVSNKGAVLEYIMPDENDYKYVGDTYVNADYADGKYDILFIYKKKLTYYMMINLSKEPENN